MKRHQIVSLQLSNICLGKMTKSICQCGYWVCQQMKHKVFTFQNGQKLKALLLFIGALLFQALKLCFIITFYIGKFIIGFFVLFIVNICLSQRNRY